MANRGALFNQNGCPMLYWIKEKLHAKGFKGDVVAYNPPIWQNS